MNNAPSSYSDQESGERKYALRMPKGWEPPYPSYQSTFSEAAQHIAMSVLGFQFEANDRDLAWNEIQKLAVLARTTGNANHVDLAECERDSAGLGQIVATCYWLLPENAASFYGSEAFKAFWAKHSASESRFGIFREVFNTPMDRFEAVHSHDDHTVGVTTVRESATNQIKRHAYWGSMRDRIPGSASDLFDPGGKVTVIKESAGKIVVHPNLNLAIIRSGQDIRHTEGGERDEYYADVEPTLIAGMNFLRDKGEAVNCYDCRFMAFLDENGNKTRHTYGFGYFKSLKDLEQWSEFHPTHKSIFGAFQQFMPKYGHIARSRFWHEVSVLPAENQFAEYINCAAGTGLLEALTQQR